MMYSKPVSYAVIGGFIVLSVLVSACFAEPYVIGSVGRAHTDRTTNTSGESAAWTQSCCDSVINNESGVWSLGMGYDWSNFAVEARYHEAGSYSQFGSWRFADDGTDEGAVKYGYGHTHVTGVSLAGIAQYRAGGFSAGMEAGLWRWQARWTEHIAVSGSSSFTEYAPVKSSGISPIIGAILGYKRLELRYEVLKVEPRDGDFNAVRELNLAYRMGF